MIENDKAFLDLIREDFRKLKTLSEKAMAQLENEADFYVKPEPESNDLAILIKHMSGNMISRWTDFFTTDGEKPDRNRDQEFEDDRLSRAQLMDRWEKGWKVFLETLDGMNASDLSRIVYIRGEAHTALKAMIRQHSHYSYHVGQIVFLAKMIRSEKWRTLSIAKGKSKEFKP